MRTMIAPLVLMFAVVAHAEMGKEALYTYKDRVTPIHDKAVKYAPRDAAIKEKAKQYDDAINKYLKENKVSAKIGNALASGMIVVGMKEEEVRLLGYVDTSMDMSNATLLLVGEYPYERGTRMLHVTIAKAEKKEDDRVARVERDRGR